MEDVEHDRIHEHEHSVKDVKERLVRFQVAAVALESVDHAVDIPDQDQRAASVEEVDYRAHFARKEPSFETANMEDYLQSDEAAEEADLQE